MLGRPHGKATARAMYENLKGPRKLTPQQEEIIDKLTDDKVTTIEVPEGLGRGESHEVR